MCESVECQLHNLYNMTFKRGGIPSGNACLLKWENRTEHRKKVIEEVYFLNCINPDPDKMGLFDGSSNYLLFTNMSDSIWHNVQQN